MEVKLQKWGNSKGIRIPTNVIKDLKIHENDRLELVKEGDKIIITKKSNNYFSLIDRISEYEGKNLCQEFDWGDAMGDEIW